MLVSDFILGTTMLDVILFVSSKDLPGHKCGYFTGKRDVMLIAMISYENVIALVLVLSATWKVRSIGSRVPTVMAVLE